MFFYLYDREYDKDLEKMEKFSTPYGGRLKWTLPFENHLIIHLKDKVLIRNKKRWSQVFLIINKLYHRK